VTRDPGHSGTGYDLCQAPGFVDYRRPVMAKKALAGSSLAAVKNWDTLTLQPEQVDQIAALIRTASRPLASQALAQRMGESVTIQPTAPTRGHEKVKRYDHRCNYQEG